MAKDFKLLIDRFLGMDASSENAESLRIGESPEMVNFQITSEYHLKRRSGFFSVFTKRRPLRGIYYTMVGDQPRYLAVVGDQLYHSSTDFVDLVPLEGTVPGTGKVTFFPFYGKVYLLTGEGILEYDGEGVCVPEAHIPTLMISTQPDGSGVLYEEVNLLTRKVKQLFCGDGDTRHFAPIITDIADIDYVKIAGVEQREDSYIWDDSRGTFSFVQPPGKGIDNVEIQYELDREDISQIILNCRFATAFGGASDTRVFLYGSKENPAVRYHSGVVEGKPKFMYFPETAVSLVGNGEPITSILCHYDRQLIFTESCAYYSYLEYMTGADGKLITAFPVFPLNNERGNLPAGQALLVENTPYTLTENGLIQWVSTNIRDERNAKTISEPIDRSLRQKKVEDALLFNRKDTSELYLCIGSSCFVYNYRLKLYYYYDFHKFPPQGFAQGEDALYFYAGDSIYKIYGNSDEGVPISTLWRSGLLDFSQKELQKKLFGLTLFLKAEKGVDLEIGLRESKEEVSATKALSIPETKYGVKKRVPLQKRRFRLLELEIKSKGFLPFSLMGLSLKGRITDRED